jgi:hypothetical protein
MTLDSVMLEWRLIKATHKGVGQRQVRTDYAEGGWTREKGPMSGRDGGRWEGYWVVQEKEVGRIRRDL